MKRRIWLMKFGEHVTDVETYRLALEYSKEKFVKNKKEEKREELRSLAEDRQRGYYAARERLEQFVLNNPVPTDREA